jgi:replicative DNA helicase
MQDLVDEIYSTHDVADHIKRLKERERRRKALLVMEDAPKDTSDEMVSNVVGELMQLQSCGESEAMKVGDFRQAKVEQWREAKKNGFVGLPFCIAEINQYLGGWRPGCFSILGGYRGEGKSTLLRQDAYTQARAGHKVMLFSLEDPGDIASASIAGMHAGVSTFHCDTGQAYEETLRKIDAGWKELADMPLWIQSNSMGINQIIGEIESRYYKDGLEAVYLDHVQYISPLILPRMTRNDTMSHYSNMITGVARRLNISMIGASQLSRSSEKENRKPKLSDLRDSGTLEQDARQIMLLYWDGEKNHHVLEVAKNNYGISGKSVDLWRMDGKHRFSAVAPTVRDRP